ncbi:hypothetical protein Tco_1432872 [Tanacetum coccineum]
MAEEDNNRRNNNKKEEEDDRSETSDYSSEDEGTEDYRRGGYHAVRIGDKFKHSRYIVQSKLGKLSIFCKAGNCSFRSPSLVT